MKKLFILAACALLVAATSCGSDNKEDEIINGGTQGGSTSSESIEVRYVEPCEVKDASTETVKRYMSKEAGDLFLHEEEVVVASVKGIYLHYTFENTDKTPYFVTYYFRDGKLSSFNMTLPFQMLYDGMKKNHEILQEVSSAEGHGVYFKTKDGKYKILVLDNIVESVHYGIASCMLY